MVDSFPEHSRAGAVVQRLASPIIGASEVILMTNESATAHQLSAAMFNLLTLYAGDSTATARAFRMPVSQREGPRGWIEREERVAERVVRRLRRKQAEYLPGYGFVRMVRLAVARDALQGRLRRAGR